jgi:hypothetical protein
MAGQTLAWLITIYYTIRPPCFSEIQVPNNSLLPSKKWKANKKKKYCVFVSLFWKLYHTVQLQILGTEYYKP